MERYLLVFSVVWVQSQIITCTAEDTVIVKTKYGPLKGISEKISDSLSLNKFYGVPYASPPIGKYRFRHAPALKPWSGVFDATYHKNSCMQEPFDRDNMRILLGKNFNNFSEDCLYMNIFTPYNVNTKNKLYPVMMFIHGGSYVGGSAQIIHGEILPRKGVVLVVIQYRLGAFGFLSSGDHHSPGNFGLHDQVVALKWIKENINSFGGNPNHVTIFGQSAGAASVGLHLTSEVSKGLFHQAIMQSGVDTSPWAVHSRDSAILMAKQLAYVVDCPSDDSEEMIECMRNVDAQKIANFESDKYQGDDPLDLPWSPVIESGDNSFLAKPPHMTRKSRTAHNVRVLAGFTHNEGAALMYMELHRTSTDPAKGIDNKTYDQLLDRFFPIENEAAADAIHRSVKFRYTRSHTPHDNLRARQELINLLTDYAFAAPTHEVLHQHSLHNDTYMFVFNYRSKHNRTPEWMGVVHNDDLPYVFGEPFRSLATYPDSSTHNKESLPHFDDEDRRVSDLVMEMWTNFAKYGNPTVRNSEHFCGEDPVQWLPFKTNDSENYHYFHIKHPCKQKLETNFRLRKMHFWNHYYRQELEKYGGKSQPQDNSIGVYQVIPWVAGGLLVILLITIVILSLKNVNRPQSGGQTPQRPNNLQTNGHVQHSPSKYITMPMMTYAAYDVVENNAAHV